MSFLSSLAIVVVEMRVVGPVVLGELAIDKQFHSRRPTCRDPRAREVVLRQRQGCQIAQIWPGRQGLRSHIRYRPVVQVQRLQALVMESQCSTTFQKRCDRPLVRTNVRMRISVALFEAQRPFALTFSAPLSTTATSSTFKVQPGRWQSTAKFTLLSPPAHTLPPRHTVTIPAGT